MTIERFEDLVAWQKARVLTSKIYAVKIKSVRPFCIRFTVYD